MNDKSARVANRQTGKMLVRREKMIFVWAGVKGYEVLDDRRMRVVLCLVGRESR